MACTAKIINELKVTELKAELERRGLDKTGVKATLLDRLEEAIKKEGHDINTFLINTSDEKASAPSTPLHNSSINNAIKTPSLPTTPNASVVNAALPTTIATVATPPISQKQESTRPIHSSISENNIQPEDDDEVTIIEESNSELNTSKTTCVTPESSVKVLNVQESSDVGDKIVAPPREKEQSVEKTQSKQETQEDGQTNLPQKKVSNPVERQTQVAPGTVQSKNAGSTSVNENAENQPMDKSMEDKCSLWISNIASTTKASDLKALFTEFGKVVTAKIFTTRSAKSPACFGYVTMADPEIALTARNRLHRFNFKGKIISIESGSQVQKQSSERPAIQPPEKTPPVEEPIIAEPKADEEMAEENIEKTEIADKEQASSSSKLSSRSEIKPPPKSPPKGSESRRSDTYRRESSKPSSSVRKPASYSSRSRGGGPTRSISMRASSFAIRRRGAHKASLSYRQSDRVTMARERSRLAVDRFSRGGAGSSRPVGRYNVISTDYGRRDGAYRSQQYYDEQEVMRLMRENEEGHRKREEALERDRERTQLRLEREKLERERLEVQQMKLQLQIEAQQQATAAAQQQAVAAYLAPDSKDNSKRGSSHSRIPSSHKAHENQSGVSNSDSRLKRSERERAPRIRSRSPRSNGSRGGGLVGSRTAVETRYAAPSVTKSADRKGGRSDYYAGSQRRTVRSPVRSAPTNYGGSSYATAAPAKRSSNPAKEVIAFNERFAALNDMYTSTASAPADQYSVGNGSSYAGRGGTSHNSSYNRINSSNESSFRFASAPQSHSSYSTVPSTGSAWNNQAQVPYEAPPGSWSRPQSDWYGNTSSSSASYEKPTSSYARRY